MAHAKGLLEPIVAHLPANFAAFDPCALPSLRAINLLLALFLPFLYASLLHLLHGLSDDTRPGRRSYDWQGLVIAMFPLVQWWSWLFYTDMASVVCIWLCWRTALQQRHVQSALVRPAPFYGGVPELTFFPLQLGAISLLFRQTNIVWIAFIAAQAAIRELELPKKEVKLAGGKAVDPQLWDARPGEFGHLSPSF